MNDAAPAEQPAADTLEQRIAAVEAKATLAIAERDLKIASLNVELLRTQAAYIDVAGPKAQQDLESARARLAALQPEGAAQ